MINYLNAENNRFLKSKTFHITNLVLLLLIIAGTTVVYISSGQAPENASPTPADVYFRITLGMVTMIIFVNIIYASVLNSKDLNTIPLALQNGISRREIYITKLIVILFYILVTEAVFMGIVIAFSELLFKSGDMKLLSRFIFSYLNLLPMIISSLVLTYVLIVNKVKEIFATGLVFLLFGGPLKFLILMISNIYPDVLKIMPYTPTYIIEKTMSMIELDKVGFYKESYLVGLVITVLCLGIGYNIFVKRDF